MNAPRKEAARIAELNDQLRNRAGFPNLNGLGQPNGLVIVTRGIIELDPPRMIDILWSVRHFDDFTEDNDPHGEHDFGSIMIEGAGKIFWKIDYYADSTCRYGSEDSGDPAKCFRVLTIMLAGEY